MLACSVLTGDLGRTIAIEVDGPLDRDVEESDTLWLTARAIDAAGDTVPDATITWQLMSLDTGVVAFVVDSLAGSVAAEAPGTGSVRALVDNLHSAEITIEVLPAPDSIAAADSTQLSISSSATVSPNLEVVLYDLTTTPGSELTLGAKSVTYSVVFPAPGTAEAAGIFLATTDTVPGLDPHTVIGLTESTGRASAHIRRNTGTNWPDSIVVTASATTAVGETVTGSPIRFLLTIDNN